MIEIDVEKLIDWFEIKIKGLNEEKNRGLNSHKEEINRIDREIEIYKGIIERLEFYVIMSKKGSVEVKNVSKYKDVVGYKVDFMKKNIKDMYLRDYCEKKRMGLNEQQ